ncbi:hypothetical protein FNAPI_1649 [Fusarium napiforme]|uniref:Uncharacterized protein n=1 Tax=Fusarium napiforme TaxID=42672 RepID=A0A8H5K126_9HYPO|nr:hypothetical protein FNAPI_1649 [Fusarium napiforme]
MSLSSVTEKDPSVLGSQSPKVGSVTELLGVQSVPLDQRADHPRLEEAVKLLLCYQHKATDFEKELEDASQKFRDAAEAAKKAEAARVKQEKPIPQKPEPDSDSDSDSGSDSDSESSSE